MSGEEVSELGEEYEIIADEKKSVAAAERGGIVNDERAQPDPTWNLTKIHVTGGNMLKATATVSLDDVDGKETTMAAVGTGPVDAIYQAIHSIVQVPNRLVSYKVHSVTNGIDSVGEVTTQLVPDHEDENSAGRSVERVESVDFDDFDEQTNPQTGEKSTRTFTGQAANTDILVASARSYLSALNKLIEHKKRAK